MLMEVEPASEVTGGLAGNKNFDSEQLEIVQIKVLEYLKSHGHTTYREIALYIKQIGLLNSAGSDQKEEYLKQIVDLLVFDQTA